MLCCAEAVCARAQSRIRQKPVLQNFSRIPNSSTRERRLPAHVESFAARLTAGSSENEAAFRPIVLGLGSYVRSEARPAIQAVSQFSVQEASNSIPAPCLQVPSAQAFRECLELSQESSFDFMGNDFHSS